MTSERTTSGDQPHTRREAGANRKVRPPTAPRPAWWSSGSAVLVVAVILGLSCDARQRDESEQTGATVTQALSVPTQGGSNARNNAYVENAFTIDSVSSAKFRQLASLRVNGKVYAQPLSVGVSRNSNTTYVIVATTENDLYAFDAHDYTEKWHTSFGLPADFVTPHTRTIPNGIVYYGYNAPFVDPDRTGGFCKSNVGRVGILSTPVAENGFVYAVAESEFSVDQVVFTINKVEIGTGRQVASQPIDSRSVGGQSSFFEPNLQLQRPGLLLSNGVIYVAFSGHCDVGDYRGWVVAYDATTLRPLATYCDTCALSPAREEDLRGGIWQSGAGLAADANGNVIFMSGNGGPSPRIISTSDPYPFGRAFGNSFVSLDPSAVRAASLAVHTWFTPFDNLLLNKADLDLGSAGPVYIESEHLVYGGGKSGKVYLLNSDDFGHYADGDRQIPDVIQATCPVLLYPQPHDCSAPKLLDLGANDTMSGAPWPHIHGTPPYWEQEKRIFVWGQGDYPRSHTLNVDVRPRKFLRVLDAGGARQMRTDGAPASLYNDDFVSHPASTGGLLSLSTNSLGEGILWATWRDVNPPTEDSRGKFAAFDGRTLRPLFAPVAISSQAKMTAPTIANGRVYVPTFNNEVLVFGLAADDDGDGIPEYADNCLRSSILTRATRISRRSSWPRRAAYAPAVCPRPPRPCSSIAIASTTTSLVTRAIATRRRC